MGSQIDENFLSTIVEYLHNGVVQNSTNESSANLSNETLWDTDTMSEDGGLFSNSENLYSNLGITSATQEAITIANPLSPNEEITISWDELTQYGLDITDFKQAVLSVYETTSNNTTNNNQQFLINDKHYSIEDILNSTEPILIENVSTEKLLRTINKLAGAILNNPELISNSDIDIDSINNYINYNTGEIYEQIKQYCVNISDNGNISLDAKTAAQKLLELINSTTGILPKENQNEVANHDLINEKVNTKTNTNIKVTMKNDSLKTIIVNSPVSFTAEEINDNTIRVNGNEYTFKETKNNPNKDPDGKWEAFVYKCKDGTKMKKIVYATGSTEYRVYNKDGKAIKSAVLDKNNEPSHIKEYHENGKLKKASYCNENKIANYDENGKKVSINTIHMNDLTKTDITVTKKTNSPNSSKIITVNSPVSFSVSETSKTEIEMDGNKYVFKESKNNPNKAADESYTDYTYKSSDGTKVKKIKYANGSTEYRVYNKDGKAEKAVVLDKNGNPSQIKEYYENGKLKKASYCNENKIIEYDENGKNGKVIKLK